MPQRPTHYERSKSLFESNFGIELPSIGIHTENQFRVEYPEQEYSPAEAVMEIREDYDLVFK